MTAVPEVVDTTPGYSQQQGQRTAPHQNRNAPEQRVAVKEQQAVRYNNPYFPGILPLYAGMSPKDYGIYLQRTGRQWRNMRERRSRKYTG